MNVVFQLSHLSLFQCRFIWFSRISDLEDVIRARHPFFSIVEERFCHVVCASHTHTWIGLLNAYWTARWLIPSCGLCHANERGCFSAEKHLISHRREVNTFDACTGEKKISFGKCHYTFIYVCVVCGASNEYMISSLLIIISYTCILISHNVRCDVKCEIPKNSHLIAVPYSIILCMTSQRHTYLWSLFLL